jgi:hypothetical protein
MFGLRKPGKGAYRVVQWLESGLTTAKYLYNHCSGK